jgi:hypothetical protein
MNRLLDLARRRAPTLLLSFLACVSLAGAEQASWPDLASPPKATGGGENDAAVIVGAEKYAFVEAVPGAKDNADAWHAYLTETLKVPAEKVALLRDDDATNDEIRQAAVEKASEVEPGGTLWFVFIGHGAPSKDGKDGLLVGVDAQRKADSVYKRSLSRNELLGILAKGKQSKTVVLLDACFSGKTTSGETLVANLQPLVTMRGLPAGVDRRTILLSAAKSDQFAGSLPKARTPRPAFSYLALGALRGWAADAQGKVTAQGIVDYSRKALNLAHDRRQTPELSMGAPATVLGSGREEAPNLARIDRGESPAELVRDRGGDAPLKTPGVDQENTALWEGAWTNLENDVRQVFGPSRPRLTAVEVDLLVGNPGPAQDTLTLNVLDTFGAPIATVTQVVPASRVDRVRFILPNEGLALTVGNLYSIQLKGGHTFGWKYVMGGYEKGYATFNGKPLATNSRSTFLFRTF